MHIACATTPAAADVLSILLSAHLYPVRDFRLTGAYPPGTPIYIILSAPLAADLVAHIRAIPDITIVEDEAT
jgi:uncharacterized protein YjlB